MKALRTVFALLLCSIVVGCSGGSGADCQVNEDCASGFCKLDGTCGPAPVDGAVGDTDAPGDGASALCNPNHDGIISANELPMAAGKSATFRIATDATWNTAGTAMTDGSRVWDLSGALANDTDESLTLDAPAGTWWAADYPEATYSALLAAGSDLRGVFKLGTLKLELLGVVSPDGGTTKTELDYDGPASILAVPLQAGKSWTSTSTVSGPAYPYLAVAYTEKYESRVDHVGTMKTPYGEFPVVRVVTDLTRTSGGFTVLTKRTFSWVAECFGPVATVSSQDNESSSELTSVAEARRLAP
jgi:hypothetical protein